MGVLVELFPQADDGLQREVAVDADPLSGAVRLNRMNRPAVAGTAMFSVIAKGDMASNRTGNAWRESQIRTETALAEIRLAINDSTVFTDIWKINLINAFHFVREEALPHQAFRIIVAEAENYLEAMRVSGNSGVTPGEFISNLVLEYVVTRRRLEMGLLKSMVTAMDRRAIEMGRAESELRANGRRRSLRVV